MIERIKDFIHARNETIENVRADAYKRGSKHKEHSMKKRIVELVTELKECESYYQRMIKQKNREVNRKLDNIELIENDLAKQRAEIERKMETLNI